MNLYRSLEVRWFDREPIMAAQQWFELNGLKLKGTWDRSDLYLLNGVSLFSVKLREGRLEVKIRTGEKILAGSGLKAGFWEKWSYGMNDRGAFFGDQFDAGEVAGVAKERLLLYSSLQNPGLSGQVNSSSACQIEYSRILINDQTHFSFGLEAFGEDPDVMIAELENAIGLLSTQGAMPSGGSAELKDYPAILAPLL